MQNILKILLVIIFGGIFIYIFFFFLQKPLPTIEIQNNNSLSQRNNTTTDELITIKLFFGNSKLDPEVMDCQKLFAVDRQIPKTEGVAQATLTALLQGPTEDEKTNGYFTSLNPDIKIQSLTITDGIAKVDFDKQLEFQVGGSCRVAAIHAQIVDTLKQFPTVQDVLVSIDGHTEDILQP